MVMKNIKRKLKAWFIPGTENDYKPRILRNKAILYFAIAMVCLKLIFLGFLFLFPNSAYFSAITTNRLVELTNDSRQQSDLPPLEFNKELSKAAYLKAKNILEQDYFAHTSPSGISPWYWFKQVNYDYSYAGENLAMDFVDAETLHNAWMNSSGHRKNILSDNYEEMGIAIVTGEFNGRQTTIAVCHFGSKFEQPGVIVEKPQQEPQESPDFKELEQEELASKRESEKEPIPAKEEERVEPEIVAETKEEIRKFEEKFQNIQEQKTPKILGVLVEKSDEIVQNVYIYSLLFIVLAVILNIFVKFEVQHKGTIVKTILIIGLIIVLIVIGNKEILNIGINII